MKQGFLFLSRSPRLKIFLAVLLAIIGLALVLDNEISLAGNLASPEHFSAHVPSQPLLQANDVALPLLPASGGISGTVINESSVPLSGIEVTAYREQTWGWEQARTATTDENGNYNRAGTWLSRPRDMKPASARWSVCPQKLPTLIWP